MLDINFSPYRYQRLQAQLQVQTISSLRLHPQLGTHVHRTHIHTSYISENLLDRHHLPLSQVDPHGHHCYDCSIQIIQNVGKSGKTKEELPIENELQKDILHAFIIPSYKEDVELLSDTLDYLAAHPWAKARILIFMAMEAHEDQSDVKAEQLIKKY